MPTSVIAPADVEIVSHRDLLSRAGWSAKADPDTNLDRLHEVLMAEQTHYYLGEPGAVVDPQVAMAQAAAKGCLRVTYAGA